MPPESANWQRPEAFLYAWDFSRDSARFLHLGRTTLLNSSFLDERIATDSRQTWSVSLKELLEAPDHDARPARGFIFHTAFCCSTLFARSLDLPGRTLVLREPTSLLQLADLKRGLTSSPRTEATLLTLTLDLLARPFAPGEHVIIKPTNLASNLAEDILALHPGNRAVVLYDELEPFLLSVLKRPRESARGIEQFLSRLVADLPRGRPSTPATTPRSLPARAALAWALQIEGLRHLLAGSLAERARVLGAGQLLAAPAATLATAAGWLGVPLEASETDAITRGPLWARHAKHPGRAYSPSRRREEQELARRVLAVPVSEGLAYAERFLGVTHADLPDRLRLLS